VLADEFLAWAEPQVSGYMWFTARDIGCWPPNISTYLFDDDGELTPLGEWYEGY
jgi:hypothetical protein